MAACIASCCGQLAYGACNGSPELRLVAELPEVEAARALAERWCRGKTIVKATVQQDESEW